MVTHEKTRLWSRKVMQAPYLGIEQDWPAYLDGSQIKSA